MGTTFPRFNSPLDIISCTIEYSFDKSYELVYFRKINIQAQESDFKPDMYKVGFLENRGV